MKTIVCCLAVLLSATATGQQFYKCPSPTPGSPPVIQQMPCSPQGGGETLTVTPIKTGAGSGLSDNAKAYLQERDQYRADEAKAAAEEATRQEALASEHRKSKASEEQARATWYMGKSILMNGRR